MPDVRAATSQSVAATRAQRFQSEFVPRDDVDYTWVEDCAKSQYEYTFKVFADLDAKATAIITHVTSGTGLLALGTVTAVYAAKIPVHVVLAAMPAFVFAVLAVRAAALARAPMDTYPLPPADELVLMAHARPKGGRASLIPMWQWAGALMGSTLKRKADLIGRATWLMTVAVALLAVPMLMAVLVR